MARRRMYTAHYELDSEGHWSVYVEPSAGQIAVSDGGTLEAARRRIRIALADLLECSEDSFALEDAVKLPAVARKRVERARQARTRLAQTASEVERATRNAVRALTELGLSRRDAGDLLGLTGQRVQQVLG